MFVIIIIVIIIVIVIVIVIVSSNSNKRPRLGCGGWAVGAGIPQHHFLMMISLGFPKNLKITPTRPCML